MRRYQTHLRPAFEGSHLTFSWSGRALSDLPTISVSPARRSTKRWAPRETPRGTVSTP